MNTRLDMTVQQLLQAMEEAASHRDEQLECVTRQEIEDELGWGTDRVLKMLRVLKNRGAVRCRYVLRENIAGVMTSVPAYELTEPSENGTL